MAIILASQSPRRQELFRLLGVEYAVETADIDETMNPALPPEQEVARVCEEKACCIAGRGHADDLIVSADTIVVVDHTVLGKPQGAADAARMLHLLSGRTHTVMTGLCVLQQGQAEVQVVKTEILFRTLLEEEIQAYIATGEPMDKAGAYGIQGRASVFVQRLEGDYFSVMGLPLCPLAQMLRRRGVQILAD